ncbi:hypothetical protein A33M_3459 [Rhodovulum sp. PH10]|nr:hypothetical protein A33M_3459 [Rhodovulum sp. PH10]
MAGDGGGGRRIAVPAEDVRRIVSIGVRTPRRVTAARRFRAPAREVAEI